MGSGSPAGPQRLSWEGLSESEQVARWEDLAEWVEWLRRTYLNWVELPDCWLSHESLRTELRAFRYWHLEAAARDEPEESVRWHQALRRSAESWRSLADCRHESPLSFERDAAAKRAAAVRAHLHLILERGPAP
jgi:hypothetical protein